MSDYVSRSDNSMKKYFKKVDHENSMQNLQSNLNSQNEIKLNNIMNDIRMLKNVFVQNQSQPMNQTNNISDPDLISKLNSLPKKYRF